MSDQFVVQINPMLQYTQVANIDFVLVLYNSCHLCIIVLFLYEIDVGLGKKNLQSILMELWLKKLQTYSETL